MPEEDEIEKQETVIPSPSFEKYFQLDEAVGLLPFVEETFEQGHQELSQLQDEIVLYKRMYKARKTEKNIETKAMEELLDYKWHVYQDCFYKWAQVLTEKGIQVKDFREGLIDFPYKAKDGREFLLCWRLEEEGLFYFHDLYEGFRGRKPITLLPD